MLEYIENTPLEEAQRSAAAAHVRHHRELQALAAARIEQAAARTIQRRRRRWTTLMRPLLLDVGARVRVSFLASSHVRQQVKTQLIKAFSPTYSVQVYVVKARHLAPGSRRVVLYDIAAEGELLDGQQQPTRIVNTRVRLPLQMVGVDRRYLQPLAAEDAVPTFAAHFPHAQLLLTLPFESVRTQASQQDGDDNEDDDLYEDLESAVS
jgi:hypothetical protein